MKYRYRLRVGYRNARTRYWSKKSESHAADDLSKLSTEARNGTLSPYWDGAVVTVERSEIGTWEILNGPVELRVETRPVPKRLSPPQRAGGESGARSENGESLQPHGKDTT